MEENIVELTSDKQNKFLTQFINKKSSLFISSLFSDGIVKTFFEEDFPLEKIKENKAFSFHESVDEILQELKPLINGGKIHLIEENNYIRIIAELPLQKFKNIEFIVKEKKKTESEKIIELYNIVIKQNKEIKGLNNILDDLNIPDLKKDINDLKNTINNLQNSVNDLKKDINDFNNFKEELINKIKNLENDNKKVLEKKNFEEAIIINNKSDMFESVEEINFIIDQIKDKITKNKKVKLKLLYKATNDGKDSYDFHNKCDGNAQQLIFIKTLKGETLGGYTEIGFYSRNNECKDNKAFLFSLTNKKIFKYYPKNQNKTIYDYTNYGPSFYRAIYIKDRMFRDGGYIEEKSKCDLTFTGFSYDYEINSGEKYFFIQEIEVYQILFK